MAPEMWKVKIVSVVWGCDSGLVDTRTIGCEKCSEGFCGLFLDLSFFVFLRDGGGGEVVWRGLYIVYVGVGCGAFDRGEGRMKRGGWEDGGREGRMFLERDGEVGVEWG